MELEFHSKKKRLEKIPATFSDFKEKIEAFIGLPLATAPSIELKYTDSEGDIIQLKEEDDYEYFRDSQANHPVVVMETTVPELISKINAFVISNMPKEEAPKKMEIDPALESKLDISVIHPDKQLQELLGIDHLNKLSAKEGHSEETLKQLIDLVKSQAESIIRLEKKIDEAGVLIKDKESCKSDSAKSQAFKKKTPVTVHTGIMCDACRKSPISGKRFMCLVCQEFDICEACEELNMHPDHAMIRVLQPDFPLNKLQTLKTTYAQLCAKTGPQPIPVQPKAPETATKTCVNPQVSKPAEVPKDLAEMRKDYALKKAGNRYHPHLVESLIKRYEKDDFETFKKNIDGLFK